MHSPHKQFFAETHSHLCDGSFDADRPAVLKAAADAGAQFLVEIACAPADWPKAEALANGNPGFVYCAFGVHPQDCHLLDAQALAGLEKFLGQPCARALGEIGFDYARCDNSPEKQREAFDVLCALANKTGLPLVLHCRNPFEGNAKQDAYADLFGALKSVWKPQFGKPFTGVLHCFSGEAKDASAALDLGLALGVNGTVTYPKNGPLREIFKKTGLQKLVLETDCPYLPPQSRRGKRNEPSYVPETAQALAAVFGCSVEEVLETTLQNSRSLFGI
ncbi:MAG TPA: TatD family hydrolase [Elusimicrobiales bacterium]|nr:TatD family hydrolase [Elusimicrobiales bacterium]